MAVIPRIQPRLQKYQVPTSLTHSAGTITAVVGSNTFTAAVGSPTSATLYFLYLRMNSGTLTMFNVTTLPSVYRVSFPEAILVGAYYSDGASSPAFGSFVNIEGMPVSERMPYLATLTGFGTPSNVAFFFTRHGKELFVFGTFTAGTVAAVTVSATLPGSLSLETGDLSLANTTAQAGPTAGGVWTANTANPQRTNVVTATGTNATLIYAGGPQATTPLVSATGSGAFASSVVTSVEARLPISAFSITPLKDL